MAYLGRHIPTDRPGTVHVLHFDQPTYVQEGDRGHMQPTTHYVGWTGRRVERRVRQHAVPADSVVDKMPGTAEDEKQLKATGHCLRYGRLQAPECLSAAPQRHQRTER
ncbi:hypothetical protein [Phytoactinopolyspora mesophila]|uniref:Uncharacterized protein n=1 Tax=Phytoactinopolyspora mesophila TaxID=2650750 RepID=A0A7K3LXT5_9ACTN|nr:hypothetical protein [Phytoactinopolyspora mesophila]NDL55657.1 hypothetical protein [Phytoactinopolyspora mesophila]